MPSSGLPVLFHEKIQMQEEDSFIRFTSVAVTETFLASFLYRLIFIFFQNIDVAKKKSNSSESWFERKETNEEHWACQDLQQISLNVPLRKHLDKIIQSVFGFEMFV